MHPSTAGAIAGISHHIFVQYPYQRSVFETLFAYSVENAMYIAVGLTDQLLTVGFWGIAAKIAIFNASYVYCPFMEDVAKCRF